MMNFFYTLLGDDPAYEIVDRHRDRASLLGFADELAFKKIVFGFFENGATDYRLTKADPTACAQLEFFAGSLSAQAFRQKLSLFLADSDATKRLHPATLQAVQQFINASVNGQKQACAVDLIRSKDFGFIWLALTGSRFLIDSGEQFAAEDSEVEHLVNLTINKIGSLQPGEKVSFLTGNLLHETQMAVHRTQSGDWELIHCDSANAPLQIFLPSQEEIFNRDFWTQIFKTKLRNIASTIPFTERKDPRISTATICYQKHNTCHVQGQIALLKNFIVNLAELPINDAILEWKLFKIQFGSFLLRQKEMLQEDPLANICKIGHAKHRQQYDNASFFVSCIEEGKYEETLAAYERIVNVLGSNLSPFNGNPLKILLFSHGALINKLDRLFLTVDQVEEFNSKIDNIYVKYSLSCFMEKYRKKQSLAVKNLLKDIEECKALPDLFFQVKAALPTFVKEKINTRMFEMRGRPVAITVDRLQYYLSLFDKNPLWLSNLQSKHSFVDTLIQSLQAGCLEQFDSILSKLEPQDRNWFLSDGLFLTEISGQFFTDSMKKYLLKNPSSYSAICRRNAFYRIIIERAVGDLNFPLLFKMQIFEKDLIDFFISAMILRFEKMSQDEISKIKLSLVEFDPNHPLTNAMESAFALYHYQKGHFQDLLAFTKFKGVLGSFLRFDHTSETCSAALMLLVQAPSHPMLIQIYTDLLSYALKEKRMDILVQTLEFSKGKDFFIGKVELKYISEFNSSELRFFYDAIINVPGHEKQAEECLAAMEY